MRTPTVIARRASSSRRTDRSPYRAAFAANPVGMAVVEVGADGRHVVLDVNAAMTAINGWSCDERSGRAVDALLAGPDRGSYGDGWHEAASTDGGGHETWIRWQATALPAGPDGRDRLLVQVDVITARVDARRRAQRQARLLDLIPEPVIVRALDGTVLYWNSGAAEIYGYSADQAVGRRTHDLLQTVFDGVALPELEAQLATGGVWQGRLEHRTADGRTLRMLSKHVRDDRGDGQPVILEINIDVTDRLAAEQALLASEAKFRSQFVHSTVGQLIRHVDGTIEEVNQAFADMVGYRPEDLIGMSVERLFSPSIATERRDSVAALVSGTVDAMNGELTLTRADGSLLDTEVNVSVAREPDGTVQRLVGIYLDITARKAAEQALTHRASHDALTGLANRSLLTQRISAACATGPAGGQTVGLLYLDLDGFKNVNDTFGHDTGDSLLIEVARRLLECVRGGDTVARMGGDEFVVLCPDLDTPARLNAVADRVLARLGAPYSFAGLRIDTVTASVGVTYPRLDAGAAQSLSEADQAMYRAKVSGKNRIGLYLADAPVPSADAKRTA